MQIIEFENQPARAIGGVSLIGLGIMILLGISHFWALVILIPGLAFLAAYQNGGRSSAPMAVPGMLLSGTGALLLFQSITGYWESWAYAWTLYGVFLGGGLVMMGRRQENRTLVIVGRFLAMISGAVFAGLGLLFLAMTSTLFRYVLILALFMAGGYLLKSGSTTPKRKPG